MRDENYRPVISGEVRYSDNGGFSYFWPKDLPMEFSLSRKTTKKIEIALVSLSKLDGKVSQMSKEERYSAYPIYPHGVHKIICNRRYWHNDGRPIPLRKD